MFAEMMPHQSAGLACWTCDVHFHFYDWSFLLAIMDYRPVIYYQKGKILFLVHKNFKYDASVHKQISEIRVEAKKPYGHISSRSAENIM